LKPVTILAIIVGVVVVVGAILFIDQNNQIAMMKNQKMFEDEIRWCSAEYMFDTENMERCFINAFETYGTQEQLDNYLKALQEEEIAEFVAEEFRQAELIAGEQFCREEYIGQFDALQRCLEINQMINAP